MYGLRRIATILLAAIALVVACGAALWGASVVGLVGAEIVTAGAQASPHHAGDLLISIPPHGAGTLWDDAAGVALRVPVLGGIAAAMTELRYAVPTIALVLLLSAIVLVGRAPAAPVRRTV